MFGFVQPTVKYVYTCIHATADTFRPLRVLAEQTAAGYVVVTYFPDNCLVSSTAMTSKSTDQFLDCIINVKVRGFVQC